MRAGLDNLQRLSSLGFLDSDPSGQPCLRLDTLREHAAGLIPAHRRHHRPGRRACSRRAAARPPRSCCAQLREAFPDRLAVELHRHGLEVERAIEPALLALADELGLPIVAANDVYFAKPAMHEAHDALLCIAEGRLLAEPEPPPGDAGALVQAGRAPCARSSPTCRRPATTPSPSPAAAR